MNALEVKQLRTELSCNARELAEALGVEQSTVLAWERGELFPTKKMVDLMTELRRKGPSAITRRPRKGAVAMTPMKVLADPEFWLLVRKLLANAQLRADVAKLAALYDDSNE